MLLKPLSLAAAGLAATATAFLLPPDITVDDVQIDAVDGGVQVPKMAERQRLDLNCPGCPIQVVGHHGKMRVANGLDSHLELDFAIDHADGQDRLLLNGFELYPNSDPMRHELTAPHVADIPGHDAGTIAPRLGFSLQWHPVAADKLGNLELMDFELQIIEVGSSFVDGIPAVDIKLIKADGALMIGSVRAVESQTGPTTPMEKQEECTTILCKWRAILENQVKHFRHPHHKCGKAGKMAHMMQGSHKHHNGEHRHHFGGHMAHHDGPPHHHHAFRLREHSWSELFRKFASHILIPVLVGVVAGVSVSM